MQTRLPKSVKNTNWGQTADTILRNCVHCGFCTATCPTYQLLGDELDSPRGRIYQIKQFLETGQATRTTQVHLDRCLTCRSCETTCPSGVEYAHLLDIGREQLDKVVSRPVIEKLTRYMLRKVFTSEKLFRLLISIAQSMRFILPSKIKQQLPPLTTNNLYPDIPVQGSRKMLLLDGCVQDTLSPEINAATKRVLSHLGIQVISGSGCCGAIEHHLSASADALQRIKNNIDHWWQYINDDVEVIISTASGCGAMIKDYGSLLDDEPEYKDKAITITERTRDISQVIFDELGNIKLNKKSLPYLSFHSPCTLQHGQQLNGKVEAILSQLGFKLAGVTDTHLCCGSAGTYSILQKEISLKLRDNKILALQKNSPELIATANIGCLMHLRSGADVPVVHWINLLEQHI